LKELKQIVYKGRLFAKIVKFPLHKWLRKKEPPEKRRRQPRKEKEEKKDKFLKCLLSLCPLP